MFVSAMNEHYLPCCMHNSKEYNYGIYVLQPGGPLYSLLHSTSQIPFICGITLPSHPL